MTNRVAFFVWKLIPKLQAIKNRSDISLPIRIFGIDTNVVAALDKCRFFGSHRLLPATKLSRYRIRAVQITGLNSS